MEQREILDAVYSLLKNYLANQSGGGFVKYRTSAELQEILEIDDTTSSAEVRYFTNPPPLWFAK